MTKREQELIDQHRAWRAEIDRRPETPAQIDPLLDLLPRDQRLEAARARRNSRIAAPLGRTEVRYFTDRGVTLIKGPAAELEQAWQSGETIRVRGDSGALYTTTIERVLPADPYGQAIAWPRGTEADAVKLHQLGMATYKPEPNTTRGSRRHSGTRRAHRRR